MRDELLNETLFRGLDHARSAIANWAEDYNTARSHSAPNYRTPVAYAAILKAAKGSDAARTENPTPEPLTTTAPGGISS